MRGLHRMGSTDPERATSFQEGIENPLRTGGSAFLMFVLDASALIAFLR